jgi:hypothetical protein
MPFAAMSLVQKGPFCLDEHWPEARLPRLADSLSRYLPQTRIGGGEYRVIVFWGAVDSALRWEIAVRGPSGSTQMWMQKRTQPVPAKINIVRRVAA